jgi:hypothetical protein
MTRIEVDDFGTWLAVHLGNAGNRRPHGMVDGPICCDIDHPDAVLIHTHIEDMDSVMQWLRSAASNEVAREGTVVQRKFYLVAEAEAPL